MGPADTEYIVPAWAAPSSVKALVTTCGAVAGGYGAFNLAQTVGDDPARVAYNRDRLQAAMGVDAIQWLRQVHGDKVISLRQETLPPPAADGLYSRTPGFALAVLTADCLPVFFCDTGGTEIAVAHAGWRGLAAGILHRTLAQFQQPPANIIAWLGPAISQRHFEVGEEVRVAFLRSPAFGGSPIPSDAFKAARRPGHYMCDLYQLARSNLQAAGVKDIQGGNSCTYSDSSRFYSYRREPVCGRMASIIVLQKP